jgi:alpha-tubulin suppressor-like RCC1 family protein
MTPTMSAKAFMRVAIVAGRYPTCVLTTTSGVRCWGNNLRGQLGLREAQTERHQPPAADVIDGVQAMSAAFDHTCALMATGGVRCWGNNWVDQLGDGTTTDCPIPPTADVLGSAMAVSTGANHTCALMATGGVRCWGHDVYGQLGDDPQTLDGSDRLSPPATDVLNGAQAVSAGVDYTCALMTAGGFRCWGSNLDGQLGLGAGLRQATPPTTDVLGAVQALATGNGHACVLMTTGGVRCWGRNDDGQLGDGTTIRRATPPATDVLGEVQGIATGEYHTCALMATEGVRCWGGQQQRPARRRHQDIALVSARDGCASWGAGDRGG